MKTATVNVISLLLLCGCYSTSEPPIQANDPRFAPIVPDYPVEHLVEDGALFQGRYSNSLFSDLRARRVGDIITVQLNENTNASKSANTTTSRDQTIEIDPITGLAGNPINIGGDSLQFDLESGSDFTGDAQSAQSNNLQGNISVTVVDVLPNQNLVIRGEKWLTLNNGDEYIRLTGIIRPADITPQNVIQSTQIANARIQYSGTGTFAKAQRKGWLARFFESEWWPL